MTGVRRLEIREDILCHQMAAERSLIDRKAFAVMIYFDWSVHKSMLLSLSMKGVYLSVSRPKDHLTRTSLANTSSPK